MNFSEAITEQMNYTKTTNGAITNQSSLSSCVDFFATGGSIRSYKVEQIIELFKPAFYEDKTIAVRLMFMFRDIRGGQGQRKPFRDQLNWLAFNYPTETVKLLPLVAEYGRWDDLYCLIDTPLEKEMLQFIAKQVASDFANIKEGKPISILGKWLKRINTSSPVSVNIAHKIRKTFNVSCKEYRKMCRVLNEYLSVAENLMSSNNWNEINYSHVPSQCMLKNRRAFHKNDTERYLDFIRLAQEGKVKVNAGTLYPHQVVDKILLNDISPDEASILWDNLPKIGCETNAIVVADVSGSMNGLPMSVCIALALYFSEHATGVYKDKFITFSERPQMVDVKGGNIYEKVHNLSNAHWGMTTNLHAVFTQILNAAIKHQIKPEEMVDSLYIISDMEFDKGIVDSETVFDEITFEFESNGYKLPRLIYWNVNARPGNFPVIKNTENTCMISGFSPNILKYIGTGIITPEQMMFDVINSERYNQIHFG